MTAATSGRPTVSVAMITYNHEAFIAQAVNSALAQQVDFPVEIVIGEDRSTDGTRAILQRLAEENPGRIRLLLRESNIGMMQNFVQTLRACRGEFIALLEGDDFWTDPTKLARQVEFLRANPDFAICHHNAWKLRGSLSADTPLWHPRPLPARQTLPDLLDENPIVTCTAMYRAGLITDFPEWFTQARLGDWLLHLLNARHGAVGYLDRTMAAYRQHAGSVWASQSRRRNLEGILMSYQLIVPELPAELQARARQRIDYWHEEIVETLLQENQRAEALAYAAAHLRNGRGVERLLRFYTGQAAEAAGRRWEAAGWYLRALSIGWGRTRIRARDLLLALMRTTAPPLYDRLKRSFSSNQTRTQNETD